MSATIEDAQQLLEKVAEMRKKSLEDARLTGAGFNIFSILGLEHYETSTHSAFLAELLNPEGSHGQEDHFLKLFIEHLNLEEFNDFNTAKAKVVKEAPLGRIDAEYREGGKMDILVVGNSTEGNGRKAIGIENKIYAVDQENQLGRYAAYLHKNHPEKNHVLLYLTLDGMEASEFSTKHGEVDYQAISYKKEILDWLRRCQEAVSGIPSLKEAIGQYIELIKKLTHQSMDAKAQNDLINWIVEEDLVLSAQETYNLWDSVRATLLGKLKESFVNRFDALYQDTGYSLQVEIPDNFGCPDSGFCITHTTWNNPVYIGFEKKEASLIYVGIRTKGDFVDDTTTLSAKALFERFDWGPTYNSPSWLVYTYLDSRKDISWDKIPTDGVNLLLQVVADLAGNDEFIEFMKRP
jgi:hypothetical protein